MLQEPYDRNRRKPQIEVSVGSKAPRGPTFTMEDCFVVGKGDLWESQLLKFHKQTVDRRKLGDI